MILLVALLLPAITPSQAATITVSEFIDDDPTSDNGACSLREAIMAANSDAKIDGCVAGSGLDTIILPAGTYTLTIGGIGESLSATGDLDINSEMHIVGEGAGTTIIDAGALDRVIHIGTFGAVTDVSLSGVTIRNGNGSSGEGGGIFNYGGSKLRLENCIVTGNVTNIDFGGGIFNCAACSLTIKNSTITHSRSPNNIISCGAAAGIINYCLTIYICNCCRDCETAR